jgi:Ser/Thr protein kinase RdoA (MazF antagonist)
LHAALRRFRERHHFALFGLGVDQALQQQRQRLSRLAVAGLGNEEQEQLKSLLRRVQGNLDQAG